MKNQDREEQRITSEDAWESIHATLDRSRSLMYVAGWPSILLLWGVIVSVGYLTQFVVETAFTTFADDYPWFPGPLWGVLGTIGGIGSSILGYRAGHRELRWAYCHPRRAPSVLFLDGRYHGRLHHPRGIRLIQL